MENRTDKDAYKTMSGLQSELIEDLKKELKIWKALFWVTLILLTAILIIF